MRKIIIITTLLLLALVLTKTPNAEILSSISGKVVDAKTGQALSDIHVIAETYDSGREATTDKNGIFILRDLRPGNYNLTFVKAKSKYIQPESPQMNVVLPRGKNLINVSYQMLSGGSVTGQVRNVGGSILRESLISYELINPKQSWAARFGVSKIGSDGSFLIEGLPESDGVVLSPSIPGHVLDEKTVKVLPGEVVDINFEVRLDDLTGIHGQVISSDGRPQTNAEIIVRREGARDAVAYAVTDETGKYSIIGLAAGKYNVTVFYNSSFIEHPTVVIFGSSTKLDFVLPDDDMKSSSLVKIIAWVSSFVVTDAYAAPKTIPVASKTINVTIEGPNACNNNQIAIIRGAFTAINKIVANDGDCRIGPRMRDRLKIRLNEHELVAYCPLDGSACNDGFGNHGCAKTVGFGTIGIRFCKTAFESRCGCFEAVGFHELIHTVQWSRSENLPYTCEKIVFPCGIIPTDMVSKVGDSCEVNSWYYKMF